MFNECNNFKSIEKIKSKRHQKNFELKSEKNEYNHKKKTSNETPYLRQCKKYFQKKLVIKYNILPNEYIQIQLENFIRAKYCHLLAKFKEDLLFNYEQEFLNKFYKRNESFIKLPLFPQFYKNYLKFFCSPTLCELDMNELIEEMVERKAKAFYQENYPEQQEKTQKSSKKMINTIFFTNKMRKDISRRNSLTDLSKTTINIISTNKNSVNSYKSINMLINEIGNGKKIKENAVLKNAENNNNINININNNNKSKNDKFSKQHKHKIKEITKNIKNKINLIKKRDILKSTAQSITPNIRHTLNNKNNIEIKTKSINNNMVTITNNKNNCSNKNILSSNYDNNFNKNRENKENNISKPFYHKINIVNNKIIIINNARSKANILKLQKEKIKKKNKNSLSRNNKNNYFSKYSNNTTSMMETKSKDKTTNSSIYNTYSFLLKTFKENINKRNLIKTNYNSMHTKSDSKMKHIKIIKEKKLNTRLKPSIHTYNSKKNSSNLLASYLNNYKNINNNIYNTADSQKKKLTNFQRFSYNIKNINKTQKFKNINRGKWSPFYKMINSTNSLGSSNKSNNKNKTNNILKISISKKLEIIPKLKISQKNDYRKQFSAQEKLKNNLKINNFLNKKVLSLKLSKK